jgi:hypothetical protein
MVKEINSSREAIRVIHERALRAYSSINQSFNQGTHHPSAIHIIKSTRDTKDNFKDGNLY